jgi:hypothetical protein
MPCRWRTAAKQLLLSKAVSTAVKQPGGSTLFQLKPCAIDPDWL